MEERQALDAWCAFQDTRLRIVRLLVQAGPAGLPEGLPMAMALVVEHPFHLDGFERAGLVSIPSRGPLNHLQRQSASADRARALPPGGLLRWTSGPAYLPPSASCLPARVNREARWLIAPTTSCSLHWQHGAFDPRRRHPAEGRRWALPTLIGR